MSLLVLAVEWVVKAVSSIDRIDPLVRSRHKLFLDRDIHVE